LEEFLKHNPPKFNGKLNLDSVDQWVRDLEKVFDAFKCPKDIRLPYAM